MTDIRKEAYKIILKVLTKNIFSDKLLNQSAKKIEKEKGNSNLLYQLVKGVIKMRVNLDYIASLYTDSQKYANTSEKIKILIYLGLYQLCYCDSIPDYAAVNETVDLAKKLFGDKVSNFVNAILHSYLRSEKIEYPSEVKNNLAYKYSFHPDIIQKWLEYWGEENTKKICIYYNQPPKLNIRVNTYATKKNLLIKYYQRRNTQLYECKASKNILISDKGSEVLKDVAFSEGYFSIQDASAALVVELLDPQQNESILDFFAAPGGKTTYISELMKNSGEVIAIDKFPHKIKLLKQAVERLQLSNIKIITDDAFHFGPIAAAFDKVLLDVPCSGWGVFQKKAELRWQFNQDIPKLLKLQGDALKRGSLFVRNGGFLIYSTCTLNIEENEKQIENFLIKHPHFELVSASDFISSNYVQNNYLKTLPFIHNMDGVFAAKMRKIK